MKLILILTFILLSCRSYSSPMFNCEPKFNNPNTKRFNLMYEQETIAEKSQTMILRSLSSENLSSEIDMIKEVCEALKDKVSTRASKIEWITIRYNPYSSCKWTSRERRVGFELSQLGSQLADGRPTKIWFYPYGPTSEEVKIEATDPKWDDVAACWP